jgi:hypothetical protein
MLSVAASRSKQGEKVPGARNGEVLAGKPARGKVNNE